MLIPLHFAQVNLLFSGNALPSGAEMTFGIDLGSVTDDPVTVGATIAAAYHDANIESIQGGDCKLSGVRVKFGPNDTGAFGTFATSHAGTAANPCVPANTALLIAKHTDTGGRAGRGHMFMPGLPASTIDPNGSVHSGTLTTAQTVWGDFFSNMGGAGLPLALLHAEGGSSDDTPHEIISLSVAAQVATQRRRLRR